MTAPKWFLKDLEIIDPTYFPFWNEKMGYWEMKKKMDIHYIKGRHDYHVVDPTIGVFKELNNNALDNIRYRKQLSLS